MAAIPLAWFRAGWDFASPAGDLLKIAVCDQGNGWVNLTHRVRQQAGSGVMAHKLASSRLKPV
ncbi:hypothetical protein, partial [Pseudomonas graminis]|uniref:hypothetical protein n=1 Tax=Pseudomonas graminis TaxID=158627 RepID=UPI001C31E042